MPITNVPQPLRDSLGEQATESLVELINQATDQTKVDVLAYAEERFDRRLAQELAKIRDEMSRLRTELKEDLFKLRSELKEDMAALHAKLVGEIAALEAKMERRLASVEVQMANFRADIIRWMFIFWIGQLGAMIGVLFAFLRK